jgi:hypothetical protein
LGWSQDDEDLDHDGFCARIAPTSVDIDEDGVQIYFDDGGLSWVTRSCCRSTRSCS